MTKISQLSDLGANLAAGDEFVVRDVSDISTPNKKVTSSGFIDYVIAQGSVIGFTQISAGATSPASVQCFSSGTTREVIVNTSAVERLRVTTAGLVGIGTSSPSTALDCRGNITLGALNGATANIQPTTASGTNIAGTHLTLRAGTPTGSGNSGQIQIFPSTSSAASGSTPATTANKGLYIQQQITSWDSNTSLFRLNAVFGDSASEGNRSALTGNGTVLTLDGSNSAGNSALEIVATNNANDGRQGFIRFYGSSSKNPYATLAANTNGSAYTSGQFTINTYNLGVEGEVARFTQDGKVGIGTTSPSNQLQLSTDSAGKPSTNTWTIVSDERIKEDIELADLDLCYQAVKNVPLKRFKWKDEIYTEEQVKDRHKLGWIAQDVEAIFPKAVGTHEFKYNQIFEEIIIPAVAEELDKEGNTLVSAQPERIQKGALISEDIIEDCRDLNADQLYAAMYGAMQKLISKVEALEAEIVILKSA